MELPTSSPPPFAIPPLPVQVFDSYEDAERALHAWNRQQVIDVTKGNTKKNKTQDIWQRDFKCDKYGSTQNNRGLTDKNRVRPQRSTIKIGCKMKIRLEAVDKDECKGKWKVVHLKGSSLHNHPPSGDPCIHTGHRQRDMKRVLPADISTHDLIASQTAVGISPEVVAATIRQADPDSSITAKDIANRKGAERRNDLGSDTPTELLLKQLAENGFFFKYDVHPETSRLRYLFWSHPDIQQYYKWNSNVLIMDCTYKTNASDLPLLNIIAMTNMNTVLPIAQCWLPGEKEEDFAWALHQLQAMMTDYGISRPSIILTDRDQACMNALDRLFPDVPSMVCRWHMNRNVLAKARTLFGQVEILNPAPGQDKYENTVATDQMMELYYSAVQSPTESDFEERCCKIRAGSVEFADYLEKHWWKYKTKVVHCWTSKYLHFGYRDTSSVEGTHSKCKRWLESSRGDLLTCFKKLLPWWESCIKKVAYGVESDVSKISHTLQDERYSAVVLFISRYALDETAKLWKQAHRIVRKQETTESCTGVFRRSFGRPCLHDLIDIIKSERQQKLRTDHYHSHWLTRRGHTENCSSRVLDPAPVSSNKPTKRSKKHKKNHGISSTAREPTYAERVDYNNSAPQPNIPTTFTELLLSSTTSLHAVPPLNTQLPSLHDMLTSGQDNQDRDDNTSDVIFTASYQTPRNWGRTGRRPY